MKTSRITITGITGKFQAAIFTTVDPWKGWSTRWERSSEDMIFNEEMEGPGWKDPEEPAGFSRGGDPYRKLGIGSFRSKNVAEIQVPAGGMDCLIRVRKLGMLSRDIFFRAVPGSLKVALREISDL